MRLEEVFVGFEVRHLTKFDEAAAGPAHLQNDQGQLGDDLISNGNRLELVKLQQKWRDPFLPGKSAFFELHYLSSIGRTSFSKYDHGLQFTFTLNCLLPVLDHLQCFISTFLVSSARYENKVLSS